MIPTHFQAAAHKFQCASECERETFLLTTGRRRRRTKAVSAESFNALFKKSFELIKLSDDGRGGRRRRRRGKVRAWQQKQQSFSNFPSRQKTESLLYSLASRMEKKFLRRYLLISFATHNTANRHRSCARETVRKRLSNLHTLNYNFIQRASKTPHKYKLFAELKGSRFSLRHLHSS